jgi:hypothetical protein
MPAACWAKITNLAQWICSKGTGTALSMARAAWVVSGSRLHRSARAWREYGIDCACLRGSRSGGRQMPAACWAKIPNLAQWICSKGTGTALSMARAAWVVSGSRLRRSARAWREYGIARACAGVRGPADACGLLGENSQPRSVERHQGDGDGPFDGMIRLGGLGKAGCVGRRGPRDCACLRGSSGAGRCLRLAGRKFPTSLSGEAPRGRGRSFRRHDPPGQSREAGCVGRRGPGASNGLRLPAREFGGRQMPAACWAKIPNLAQWRGSKGTGTVLSTA